MFPSRSIQFKNFNHPQGAILLWSWRARKKYIKLREKYNKHNTTNKESHFNHSIVINIEQLFLNGIFSSSPSSFV